MKAIGYFILIFFSVFVVGCYPAGPEYVEDMDIVLTNYDNDFNFQSKSTFAIPEKIVVDVNIDKNGDTTFVYMDNEYAVPILNAITSNMQNYGWTKVDISQSPDMVLLPAGISNTTYFYSWWYDWWWYDWYDWWWWYYPPYYYYPVVSSYTSGSLIMILSDPDAATNNPLNQTSAAWLSVSNGILNYSYNISRVTDAISQSFEQSPYLKIN